MDPCSCVELALRRIWALPVCLCVMLAANTALNLVHSDPVIWVTASARNVSFTGTGFLPTDTTCYVSSPSSNDLVFISACVIQAGSGTPYGGFTIGNVLPGDYVIQVTGNYGDFAQAVLRVNEAASQYAANQVAWYYPGARVSIRATGLLPTDTTCQLLSPSSNVILPGTAACVIQAGTGVAYGGFIVGNVLPGSYVIEIMGDQGDFAQTVLTVG